MSHTDINECNSCDVCPGEGKVCVNTVGSFVCQCADGYILSPDRVNCTGNDYS